MGLLMRSLSAAVLIAGWHSSYVAIAAAQDAQRETPSLGLSTPAPNLTEQKLDAAAAALERVLRTEARARQTREL
jgi:hypothetical protein